MTPLEQAERTTEQQWRILKAAVETGAAQISIGARAERVTTVVRSVVEPKLEPSFIAEAVESLGDNARAMIAAAVNALQAAEDVAAAERVAHALREVIERSEWEQTDAHRQASRAAARVQLWKMGMADAGRKEGQKAYAYREATELPDGGE